MILIRYKDNEFNSLNYIELPIKEQACGLRQVPRRGGRKGVALLNKGLSPQVTGSGQTGFLPEIFNVSMTDSKHKFVELTLYYLAGFGDVTHFVRAFTREKAFYSA